MNVTLIEPIAVPDIFVSGTAPVQDLGDGNVRLIVYAKQKSLFDGTDEHVVVGRLVMSMNTLADLSAVASEAQEGAADRKLQGFQIANASRN